MAALTLHVASGWQARLRSASSRRLCDRGREACTLSRTALNANDTRVPFDDLFYDGQAKPVSLCRLRFEFIEDAFDAVGGDSCARILNPAFDTFVLALRPIRYGTPFGKSDRIRKKILE